MSPNFSKHSYNLEEKQNVMVPNIDGITLTFALFGFSVFCGNSAGSAKPKEFNLETLMQMKSNQKKSFQ